MSVNDPTVLHHFTAGMAYELLLNDEGQKCGFGVYGGVGEDGHGKWYINNFSDQKKLKLNPPVIDWKRAPHLHVPQNLRDNVKFISVADFERFMKVKIPKEIRDFLQRSLPALPVAIKPVFSCPHCTEKYTCQKFYENHVSLCEARKKAADEKKAKYAALCEEKKKIAEEKKTKYVALCEEKKKIAEEKKAQKEAQRAEKMKSLAAPPFACGHCGKIYVRAYDLEKHVTSRVCTTTPSGLQPTHMEGVVVKPPPGMRSQVDFAPYLLEGDVEVPAPIVYNCTHCSRPFISISNLKKHEALCEEVEKQRSEKAEKKRADSQKKREDKMAQRTEKQRTEMKCSNCPRVFWNRVSFERHQKGCGRGAVDEPAHKNLECNKCGKKYINLCSHKKHELSCTGKKKLRKEKSKAAVLHSVHSSDESSETESSSTTTQEDNGYPFALSAGGEEVDETSDDEEQSVESLPDPECREVMRAWTPAGVDTGFTWPELEAVGRELLTNGTNWLRIHYRMLPGNRVSGTKGGLWATDFTKIWVEDGTIYESKEGQLYVAYQDGDGLNHEHLDATMDCCVLRLEEIGVGRL